MAFLLYTGIALTEISFQILCLMHAYYVACISVIWIMKQLPFYVQWAEGFRLLLGSAMCVKMPSRCFHGNNMSFMLHFVNLILNSCSRYHPTMLAWNHDIWFCFRATYDSNSSSIQFKEKQHPLRLVWLYGLRDQRAIQIILFLCSCSEHFDNLAPIWRRSYQRIYFTQTGRKLKTIWVERTREYGIKSSLSS